MAATVRITSQTASFSSSPNPQQSKCLTTLLRWCANDENSCWLMCIDLSVLCGSVAFTYIKAHALDALPASHSMQMHATVHPSRNLWLAHSICPLVAFVMAIQVMPIQVLQQAVFQTLLAQSVGLWLPLRVTRLQSCDKYWTDFCCWGYRAV